MVDSYVPVVQASLEYKTDNFMIMPSAYYQTYELKKNDAVDTTNSINVTSWALALDGTFKTDVIQLAAELWLGQNLSTFSIDQRSSTRKTTTMGAPVANAAGNDIKNVNSYGGWVQAGIPIKPVTIYAGYGIQQSQVKKTDTNSVLYEDCVTTQGAFINAKWEALKGFYIQPEVAYFYNGNDAQKTLTAKDTTYATGENNLGSDLYAGVHFQYDF
jgi:hypothetical protein